MQDERLATMLASCMSSLWSLQKGLGDTAGGHSSISFGESGKDTSECKPATSWFFQMRVLFVRFVRSWYRTPHLLLSFLAQYLFAGIFLGKSSVILRQDTCHKQQDTKSCIISSSHLCSLMLACFSTEYHQRQQSSAPKLHFESIE